MFAIVPPAPLVGRERELATLRQSLAAALSGRGTLALMHGEAGIGKTTLAEAIGREAADHGALVLVGRGYDLSETPPYGPWLDLFDRLPPDGGLSPPAAFATRDGAVTAASQAALFRQVADWLAGTAAARPLVLILDDLHWADAASLDLLRAVARHLDTQPVLILATYRDDALPEQHPLAALLPALVREAGATRVTMRRLTRDDTQALVRTRYRLDAGDIKRLTGYLHERAGGNPFFTGELLRTLEEEAILHSGAAGDALGSLEAVRVPSLVRQVIEGRLSRLGEETRQLLAVAAVIGQEVPLALWEAVTEHDEETLLTALEGAIHAALLTTTAAGARFTHALIREALYEGMLPPRRRIWHRRVGEALAALSDADPDAVADHFRRADDPRAAEWLFRAGLRAQRAYAWLIAAERFAAAATIAGQSGAGTPDRDELILRAAFLRRYAAPHDALPYIETALREIANPAIRAQLLAMRGAYRCFLGEIGRGIADVEAAVTAMADRSLDDRIWLRKWLDTMGSQLDEYIPEGLLTTFLAGVGRYREVPAISARALAQAEEIGIPAVAYSTFVGLGYYHAGLGEPAEAHEAFHRAQQGYTAISHYFQLGTSFHAELNWVALPYAADQPAASHRLAAAGIAAWVRASDATVTYLGDIARLPLLFLEGEWAEALRIGLIARATGGPNYYFLVSNVLAPLAYAAGDAALAAAVVREILPHGTATAPGDAFLPVALVLQPVAATLALDAHDYAVAHDWLGMHDRWLAWSGAVLGRADGALSWSAYHRALGDSSAAEDDARQALAHANAPRQPLALLAAHRALGELLTDTAQYKAAHDHLDQSLALAEACAAPYERALTLLARAGLVLAEGEYAAARDALDAARGLLVPLAARPALARADALARRLDAARPSVTATAPAYPDGLSTREVDVLRLVAGGRSNREIAAALAISERTVNRHLTNLYIKIDAHSKADATAYAIRHRLA